MRFEMEKIDILAHRRSADPTALFHDQSIRKNPGDPDPTARMDFVTELFLEK